ncbi:hypothetical protein CsSME_00029178 [Camellia sinensis var. sinensis]
MGMNLDSGELLAVKQVLIASNGASKEKAQQNKSFIDEKKHKTCKNINKAGQCKGIGERPIQSKEPTEQNKAKRHELIIKEISAEGDFKNSTTA